jgi:hypothetical protein
LKKGRREARAVVGSAEKELGGEAVEVAAEARLLFGLFDDLDDVLGKLVLLGWAVYAAPALVCSEAY